MPSGAASTVPMMASVAAASAVGSLLGKARGSEEARIGWFTRSAGNAMYTGRRL